MTSCHICHSPNLRRTDDGKAFSPVSSDIRIVQGQIRLAVCDACHTLQKIIDPQWEKEAAALYGGYEINHQGSGSDPYIFQSRFGPGPRAEILLKFLQQEVSLPETGRLLDVGCANGNILREFHRIRPNWEMHGLENSEKWRDVVTSIPGVKGFYSDHTKLGDNRFDLIVMSHVLEHIPDPATALRGLARHLIPGGHFLIAVPDIRQNPIDLFVLDHCTHFDDATLSAAIGRAQLPVGMPRGDVLGKELIAITGATGTTPSPHGKHSITLESLCRDYLRLSAAIRVTAATLRARYPSFGIMGTSTAAAWLTGELPSPPDFYVDEDPSRIGSTVFGKPIYNPANAPEGSTVFIPMPKPIAEKIINRASKNRIHFEYLNWDDTLSAL